MKIPKPFPFWKKQDDNRGWEFTCIEGTPQMVNEQLPSLEKHGWRLAGNVDVMSRNLLNTRITVPLKRKKQ